MALPILLGLAASAAAEFAPDLIRYFAGDSAGEAAEKVIGAAKAVTGKDDPEEAVQALRADPAAVLAFQDRCRTIDASLEKAYLKDRQDARKRDLEMKKAGYRNTRADLMIFIAFCAFCFIVWQINQGSGVPPEVLAIYNMAIGAILKMIGDAFQFEFGSSRGSKEKDLRGPFG